MAYRPGVNVTTSEVAPSSGLDTSTGTAFVTGLTEKGPTDRAVRVTSLTSFVRTFGSRISNSLVHDWVEAAFYEGLSSVYVSRVTGPAPVAASAILTDGTAPVVKLSAKSVGEYGNALSASVVTASGGTQVVLSQDGAEIERSPVLATKADVLAWAVNSPTVSASAETSTLPLAAQASKPFTGGTADTANVTDAQHVAGLEDFSDDFGPGQVAAPGRTSAAAHTALLAHAEAHGRVALLDAPVDAVTVASLTATANAIKSLPNASYGILLAPWIRVAGSSESSTRVVPPSAAQAGIEARRDALVSPNVPAAGPKYPTRGVRDLIVSFNAAQGDALNEAGVSLYRSIRGVIQPYGYRTVASPALYPNWKFFNHARMRMALRHRASLVAESFAFEQIDGKGLLLGAFQAALAAVCADYHRQRSLFGAEPNDAYRVLVGDDINPLENLSNGDIAAVIQARFSPFAELVNVEIVKTPTGQNLA